jgi:hypothetical protein
MSSHKQVVMAGHSDQVRGQLVPAIHVLPAAPKDVDARDISAFTRVFDALCPRMTAITATDPAEE